MISHRKIDGQRTPRDEKRRATHNEVERRRRDKINNWIERLAKMLPESEQDHTKQGQVKFFNRAHWLSTVFYLKCLYHLWDFMDLKRA